MTLKQAWAKRLKLHSVGDKLWKKADKLSSAGYNTRVSGKICIKGEIMFYRGKVLLAECERVWAEANILWCKAVLANKGNVSIMWISRGGTGSQSCIVDGKETFNS